MGDYADDAIEAGIYEWCRDEDSLDDYLDGFSECISSASRKPSPEVGDHCPREGCIGILVERTNSVTREKFLGCNDFPICHYTWPPRRSRARRRRY